MSKVTTGRGSNPEVELDSEVVAFRSQFEGRSPLDQIVRDGAQRMLQQAIEAEVVQFLLEHEDRRDAQGNRLVVRNGYKPSREVLTGAGPLEVQQPRVRDKTAEQSQRVQFTPSVLPPYLRRSKSVDELIPWLYLKGFSTGDFQDALQSLLGENAKGSGSRKTSLAMMFKLAHTAQKGWRKLNGHETIVSLLQGKKFVNGEMQDAA